MLSEGLEKALGKAVYYARTHRHEIVTVEHLLYALLHDKESNKAIRLCGGDIAILKVELENYLHTQIPLLDEDSKVDPEPGLGFQRVLAARHPACAKFRQQRGEWPQCASGRIQ